MSLIVSEVYDALIEAGASEAKAKAAAGAIPLAEPLATKEDIAVLKEDIAALEVRLYPHLRVMAAGIVGLTVTLVKLLACSDAVARQNSPLRYAAHSPLLS